MTDDTDIVNRFVDELANKLKQISTTFFHKTLSYNITDIENFVNQEEIRILYLIDTDLNATVIFDENDSRILNSISFLIAVVKKNTKWSLLTPIDNQLIVLNIPTSRETGNPEFGVDNLKSLVKYGVGSYFNLLEQNGQLETLSQNSIEITKFRIKNLLIDVQGLHQTIQTPQLLSNISTAIQNLLDENEGLEITQILENNTELINDVHFLNSLQSLVNTWVKQIKNIIQLDHNPTDGTIQDEIIFWNEKENVLSSIKDQLDSKQIDLILTILKNSKRSHSAVSLISNLSVKNSLKQATLNNDFLKTLNVNNLYSAENMKELKLSIEDIFDNLKKLKHNKYPVEKAVSLIKMITAIFEAKLVYIISKSNLFLMESSKFDQLNENISDQLNSYDNNIRLIINIMRGLLRQQDNIFIPIKIEIPYYIKEKMDIIKTIRSDNENFNSSILSLVDDIDSSSNNNLQIYQQVYNESQKAYEILSNLNIVKLFKIDSQLLDSHKISYYQQISFIERNIIGIIKRMLIDANDNPDLMFPIFEKFQILINKPQFRLMLQQFHSILLQSIEQNLESLELQFSYQLQIKNWLSLKNFGDFSAKLIWIKQLLYQIEKIINHLELVLTKQWSNYPEGKRFSTKISQLLSEINIDSLFAEWIDETNQRISNSFMKSSVLSQVLLKNEEYQFMLNMDSKDTDISNEIKCLKSMGLQVPRNIVTYSEKVNSVKRFSFQIDESLRQFYDIIDKIYKLKDFKMLVEPEVESIHAIIKSISTKTWFDISKANELADNNLNIIDNNEDLSILNWIFHLREKVINLSSYVNELMATKDKYYLYMAEFENCEYSHSSFSNSIMTLQSLLVGITGMKSQSCMDFIGLVNKQIKVCLSKRCNKELKNFLKIWSTNDFRLETNLKRHQIIVHDLSININPSLETSKEYFLGILNSLILIIKDQKQLILPVYNIDITEELYYDFTASDIQQMYQESYNALLHVFDEANIFIEQWKSFQFLWDYQISEIEGIDDENLDIWFEVLNKFKQMRETFDTVETTKIYGLLEIDYEQAQSRIYTQFDNQHRSILDSYGAVLEKHMHQESSEINTLKVKIETLKFDLSDPISIVDMLSLLVTAKDILNSKSSQLEKMKLGQSMLEKYRHKFSVNWISYAHINDNVRTIIALVSHNEKYIKSHHDIVKSIIQDEIQNIYKTAVITKSEWENQKPDKESSIPNAISVLQKFETRFENMSKEYQNLSKASRVVGLHIDMNFDTEMEEIKQLHYVWSIIMKLYNSQDSIKTVEWDSCNVTKVKASLEDSLSLSRSLPSHIRSYPAFENAQTKIKDMLKSFSLVSLLLNSSLDPTHWDEIFNHIKLKNAPESLLLGDILDLNLLQNEKYIKMVINKAESENVLDSSINDIQQSWKEYKFEIYIIKQNISLISGWPSLFARIDDDINALESIKVSPYYPKFSHCVKLLEDKINTFSQIINVWHDAQKQWVYLLGIFENKEQLGQVIPMDLSRFENISHEFNYLMSEALASPVAIDIIDITDIFQTIKRLSESLSKIKRSLVSYLEKQREMFPRFYFIGNDDLLELIGNPTNFMVISKHIKKVFSGVSFLKYDQELMLITGIVSAEGETLALIEPVSLVKHKGLVNWLGALESIIKMSLSKLLISLNEELNNLVNIDLDKMRSILQKYPNQIIILAFQIYWTNSIEKALVGEELLFQHEISKNIVNILIELISSEMETLLRIKTENLLIELIHKEEVLNKLITDNATSLDNFVWFSEQKFYLTDMSDITVNVSIELGNYVTTYGYEYLGAIKKLAYTPLLNSTFTLLCEALDQNLGGLLLGPAGTGKTESVKSLGYNFGRTVSVFCCDNTFDVESVSRILIGLSQVGGWGCFDEFNRLDKDILSGISTQIEKLQIGLSLEDDSSIELLGKSFTVVKSYGIFITNNPNYEGRSTLPDNIKSKFLAFSLMVPDTGIITRVLLTTQGFVDSIKLSTTLVSFFTNMKKLCSEQKHYDFGLRSLKTVITHAGKLIRMSDFAHRNADSELTIIQRSCYDVVLPRLVTVDEQIFLQEIGKFEIEYKPSNDHKDLKDIITTIAKSRNLVVTEEWLLKCLQIYEIQKLNHGFMLVGPSCSGKTISFSCFLESLSRYSNIRNECYKINAKVLSKYSLFGELDYTTREWKDGIVTSIFRKASESDKTQKIWIIFDGDIDPNWVENLNSVLDDNKLLTLPTGERIPLPENVRIVFEIDSLMHATPATVTRCGIITFNSPFFEMEGMFKKFLSDFTKTKIENEDTYNKALLTQNLTVKDFKENIINTFYEILDDITSLKVCELSMLYSPVLSYSSFKIISTMFRLLNNVLEDLLKFIDGNPLLVRGNFSEFLTKRIVIIIIWSFGSELTAYDRTDFTSKLLMIPKFEHIFLNVSVEEVLLSHVVLPDGKLEQPKEALSVIDLQPHMILRPDIIIPTVDTSTYEKLIHIVIDQHNPLILCGPPGSGKTMLLLASIRKSVGLDLVGMNFSKETNINSIIKALEQSCEYKKVNNATILCPKIPGKWVILFCDELNLPKVDKYGSQLVIQFLRQLIIEKGFWHPKDCVWVSIKNIQFVGACNPVSTFGRILMTERFTNFCTTIMVDYPSDNSLRRIYNVYVRSVLKTVPDLIGYSESFSNLLGLYVALRSSESYTLNSLIRFCAYEGLRLFSDRLILEEEKEWIFEIILKTSKTHFPHVDMSVILATPILFSDWLNYEYQSVDKEILRKFVSERFNVFSEEESNVNIVLYEDLLDHALRIDRVLKNAQGHMILIGPSGSGKTTLAKFVSWMNGINVFQLNVSKNFSMADFDKTLRELLIRASVDGEKICFIIDESTVLENSFLEQMNTLLANAEVPGLFEGDEFDNLIALCLKASKDAGLVLDSNDEVYQWFVQQITNNFHVIFTMSDPYCSKHNPFISSTALFNRCVINWMGTWSQKSLYTVAEQLLIGIPLDKSNYKFQKKDGSLIGLRNIVNEVFVMIHKSVSKVHGLEIGPSQFLNLLKIFSSIFIEKEGKLQALNSHVDKGLTHLKETFLKVKQLGFVMSEKEKQLKIEDEKARKLLDRMITDQNESERKQDMSLKMQELFSEQENLIIKRRETVMIELSDVEQLIEEAQKGVLDIKKQHLTELRSMHNPPETIKLVLESICIMLGYSVHEWRDVQHVIRQDDFIASIINFKGEKQLTPKLLTLMEENYLTKSNFNYESANRASKACGPLFMWVKAQLRFSAIAVKVGPLKNELKKLENELMDTKAKLIAINGLIKDLQDEIEKYKHQYSETIRVKENIKLEMETVKEKLDRSIKLLSSLKNERQRWEANILEYQEQNNYMIGDSIIAASFIAYCGNYVPSIRLESLLKWKNMLQEYKIEFDSHISDSLFAKTATSENIMIWQKYGLPNDDQFIGNTAIMVSKFNDRFSFIIDPSELIIPFLSRLTEPKKLIITSFLDPEFNKKVENCVKFGGIVLIKDGEYFDPILNRLISKDIRVLGAGRMVVKLGDKEVDMSPDFKLFIHTKDPTFKISPFISSRMNVLDYSLTSDSIINEALNLALQIKEPEIETKRLKLIKNNNESKHQIQLYENELLTLLSSSEDNILDDDKLLSKLEIIKSETIQLEQKILESDKTMHDYNLIRDKFGPLGDFYAKIIKIFEEFTIINPIYQFSRNFLKQLLNKTLNKTSILTTEELKIKFSQIVYKEVSTSLLQKDLKILNKLLNQLLGIDNFETMSISESFINNQFIILRSSKGNDSTILVKELSQLFNNSEIIKYSMGSVDGFNIANRLIMDLKGSCKWLIIENIEISNEFLELITETISILKFNNKENSKFKLILTSKIDSYLPPLLIQTCKQIIIENEQGIKNTMIDQLLNETSMININKLNNMKPKEFKKIIFILVWFYSVIISRLRFKKGGYSKHYEINQNDLRNAERFIKKFINSKYIKNENNFEFNENIFNIIGNIICSLIFGGKFDNLNDLKLLKNFGLKLFNIKMLNSMFNIIDLKSKDKLFAPEGFNNIDYIEWIKNLPNNEPMDWIGMPEDAETSQLKIIEAKCDEYVSKILDLVK
ncbi:hypothetical protein C6P40_000845 [Pichia californica]|uniref:Dynein heavy chain, cytoplasmic n=1 Tax=Pichia californica TaxID=460514 RepID=A0A9P7BGB7_9ASCO|nr:hypothetical protein C6P40_000845 [[Candida] californica]